MSAHRTVLRACLATVSNRFRGFDQIVLHVDLIKFDQNKHSIVPLMRFEDHQYVQEVEPASVHELGIHYFGVKRAYPAVDTERGFLLFTPCDGSNSFIFDDDKDKEFLDRLNGLKPKTLMNLEDIGCKRLCCSYCGQDDSCECELRHGGDPFFHHVPAGGIGMNERIIYYSPSWFGNGKNRVLCSGKNWVVFSDVIDIFDIR